MRRLLLSVPFACLLPFAAAALPFSPGETIKYKIVVMGIHVGYQEMTFKGPVEVDGRTLLYAVADTKSLSIIQTMFRYSLHDVIHVWMDPRTLLPVRVLKEIQEGSWTDRVTVDIDQGARTALYRDKRNPGGIRLALGGPTLDILSLIYWTRSQAAGPGSWLVAEYLVDARQGAKRAALGVQRAPSMRVGDRDIGTLLFAQQGGQRVRVRMTDDERRIPLNITVGTFQVHGYTIDIVGHLVAISRP